MKLKANYLILPLLVFGVLGVGAYFSWAGMEWYQSLRMPSSVPDNWLFPVAWNLIGVLTSLSLLFFYNRAPRGLMFFFILGLFATNGLLNILWMKAFFGAHALGLAFFIALALEFNLISLMALMFNKDKLAALLLLPYTLWVGFACYLNWQVWLLN